MRKHTSSAVMAKRHEPHDSLDFFLTPPWATRALCLHVLQGRFASGSEYTAWEPACGNGDMTRPLREYFGSVWATDAHDHGCGAQLHDFLGNDPPPVTADWIITNPPFRLALAFAERAVALATVGVALFVRTGFLESMERYVFFRRHPPAVVAQFAERVALVKGRLDRKASSATAYCWVVWSHGHDGPTRLQWIPPCRRLMEHDDDWPEDVA